MRSKVGTSNKVQTQGTALVTIIAVIFILSILASVILVLLANQVRVAEHDVRRTRALHAAEATMVRELELLRRKLSKDSNWNVGGIPVTVDITTVNNVSTLDLTSKY